MAESHVISALVAKRAKLSGDIAKLDKQIRFVRERIAHIDGCLKLFGYDGDPQQITPIRTKGAHLLKRGQLQRTVLEIRRVALQPMDNREIARKVIQQMGWAADDGELLVRVARKVKDVTKRFSGANNPKTPG